MREFQIAGIALKNRYVQAPLAGYSDHSMREMGALKGASLVYSEMESCEALVYNSKPTLKDLEDTKLDDPFKDECKLALQIFGGKKENILKSIPIVEANAHYDFLDFNCGCPVPKVIRQGSGSYWLNRQDELVDVLKEMVKISSKPVIVKLRIGYGHIIDMPALAKRIEEVGVQALAIHGRTRSEGFSGDVHFDVIRDIKRCVSIPVIANGSITTENVEDVFRQSEADAVMIGQGAIGYPKIFEDLIRLEQGEDILPTTLEGQCSDLIQHLKLIFSYKDERPASDIMRSISVRYLKRFPDAKSYRLQLVHARTLKEYLEIVESMQNKQNAAHFA